MMLRTFQVAPGVVLSAAAFDVGIKRPKAGPWTPRQLGDRWVIGYGTAASLARGPSGRTRTFGDELAAAKVADELNRAAA